MVSKENRSKVGGLGFPKRIEVRWVNYGFQ